MSEFVGAAALIYNGLIVIVLLGIGLSNPGLIRRGYPPALKTAAAPLTPEQTVRARKLVFPLMAVMLGLPLGYLIGIHLIRDLDFLGLWLEGFVILFSFNLFDLLIIDWLVFCTITPKAVVLPGTEGHPAYKDYLFHFVGFLKGTVIVAVVALVYTGMAWTLTA